MYFGNDLNIYICIVCLYWNLIFLSISMRWPSLYLYVINHCSVSTSVIYFSNNCSLNLGSTPYFGRREKPCSTTWKPIFIHTAHTCNEQSSQKCFFRNIFLLLTCYKIGFCSAGVSLVHILPTQMREIYYHFVEW